MNYAKEIEIKDLVKFSLKEDIGQKDITTDQFIPENRQIKAIILAKEPLVACGLGLAALVLRTQDKEIKFKSLVKDGDWVKRGRIIARISGKAKSILTAERVVLNFLSLLCGIATKTCAYVKAVRPYRVKIMDTRKTIPGLRLLEKYAVRIGGGFNHRLTLDEMVIVKDNHLATLGGIKQLTGLSRKYKTEIEVKNLKEFRIALALRPDMIMLDNMGIAQIKKAVRLRNRLSCKTPKLEASGGITLKNIRKVAATGVEMISVGSLTHSVSSVDISLEIL